MMTNPYSGKPNATTLEPIANNGFFPDLAIADFITSYRIPSEYADDVIKDGLILAMIDVNSQLIPVSNLLITYADLVTYCAENSEQIGGVEVLIKKYQEAVFCYAKANLLQQFMTMNRKAAAENLAKEAPETEMYWLNRSHDAVAFIFKKLGITYNPSSRVTPFAVLI